MMAITLIGLGRVGSHLLKAFAEHGITVREVFAGRTDERQSLCDKYNTLLTDDWENIQKHQGIYILAVPDNAIESVAQTLGERIGDTALVVHTSGNTLLDPLRKYFSRPGLFYPLLSFSKDVDVEWTRLPIFIQSDNKADHQTLETLGSALGADVISIRDEQRPYLHMAAVIANNFTNALYRWSKEILDQQGLSFSYLHPLIRQGLEKSLAIGPVQAQTGPAQRGDLLTIQTHLEMLANDPDKKELYLLLSELINPELKEEI